MSNPKIPAKQGATVGQSAPASGARNGTVVANGKEVVARVPCSVEEFLVEYGLLPRSVVVEHNGEAVAPSEFTERRLQAGDRLEIVKIVAGG